MNAPPPRPELCGSTRPRVAWTATAASIADPPARSTFRPASTAAGLADATIGRGTPPVVGAARAQGRLDGDRRVDRRSAGPQHLQAGLDGGGIGRRHHRPGNAARGRRGPGPGSPGRRPPRRSPIRRPAAPSGRPRRRRDWPTPPSAGERRPWSARPGPDPSRRARRRQREVSAWRGPHESRDHPSGVCRSGNHHRTAAMDKPWHGVLRRAMAARPEPLNLITDVPGLAVGQAADEAARTGVTVILPDRRAVCGVDVRGGAPGTRETDALSADTLVEAVDAIVLSLIHI